VLSILLWASLAYCQSTVVVQQRSDPQLLDRCRKGEASACEAAGFVKPLARELARLMAEKNSSKQWDRVRKVTDPELLVAYFRLCRCTGGGTERIPPPRFADLAVSDPDPDVRNRALWMVDDQAVLGRVATTDEAPAVRAAATRKLKDISLLSMIAAKDASPAVRTEAVKHLTDNTVLAAIARHDTEPEVRGEALSRLTDPGVLDAILGESPGTALPPGVLRSPAVYADSALLEKVLARMPGSSSTQMNLCTGWWVLEQGSTFHFLGIQPAEGNEVLVFSPDGKVLFMAGTIQMVRRTYSLPDSRTLVLTSGGTQQQYQFELTTTTLTLASDSGKAIYRRVPPRW